jgi:tripartite-type tricarboxylate transporter receptor subunit TctC
MSRIWFCGCVAAMLATFIGNAGAQSWPTRPITIISPFAAGTSVDLLARRVANALSEQLKQPVITDDRPGANGNIGATAAAKSEADGYTFLLCTPGIAVQNKFIYKTMPFDADRDFDPIVLIAKAPLLIVVNPKLPVRSLPELLAFAKANPGKVSVSSTGVGSQGHITLEMLNRLSGADMVHVPYNVVSEQNLDLVGGRIEAGIGNVTLSLGFVLDGSLRALAITSKTRMARLPDVPTVEQAGFPGFESVGGYALEAPHGTAPEVLARVNRIVNAYLGTETGRNDVDALGMQPAGGTPDDVRAWNKTQNERWGPIIRAAVPN